MKPRARARADKVVNRSTLKKKAKPNHTNDLYNEKLYWTAVKYGVTLHAIRRFSERVLGTDYENYYVDSKEQVMISKCIVGNLDFELTTKLSGVFPFLDDFKAVIKDGRVLTIKG